MFVKTMRLYFLFGGVFAGSVIGMAQSGAPPAASTSTASTYDPRLTFAPLVLPEPVNAYRSGSGAPGPQYWQNEADYVMHAALDTEKKVLTNDEVITYTNNSPDTLTSLWIHLEQNSYRKDLALPHAWHRPGRLRRVTGRWRSGRSRCYCGRSKIAGRELH